MITDELLRTAAAIANVAIVESYEQDYNPNLQHEFSPTFEQKMRRLKRRAKHPRFYRSMRRVASVLLVLLIGGSAWLVVDAEARGMFFGWIKETYCEFFIYRFPDAVGEVSESSNYRPTWLPDGYTEYKVFDVDGGVNILYRDDAESQLRFCYIYAPNHTEWYFDVSHMICSKSSVNGQPAEFFLSTEEQTANTLVWTLNEPPMAFEVRGFLSESELIRIAESVSAEE